MEKLAYFYIITYIIYIIISDHHYTKLTCKDYVRSQPDMSLILIAIFLLNKSKFSWNLAFTISIFSFIIFIINSNTPDRYTYTEGGAFVKTAVSEHEYSMQQYAYLNNIPVPEIYSFSNNVMTMQMLPGMTLDQRYGQNVPDSAFERVRELVIQMDEIGIDYPDLTGHNFMATYDQCNVVDRIWVIDFEHARRIRDRKQCSKFVRKFIDGHNGWNPQFTKKSYFALFGMIIHILIILPLLSYSQYFDPRINFNIILALICYLIFAYTLKIYVYSRSVEKKAFYEASYVVVNS